METLASRIVKDARRTEEARTEFEADIRSDEERANIPAFDTARDRASNASQDGIIRASKSITLADKDVADRIAAIDASSLPVDAEISDQLKSIIDQEDPLNPGNYKHAAYFAQTGGRSGFAYFVTTASGVVEISFPEGLLVTTSIPLVQMLRKDLKENNYLRNQIREVTTQQYRELLEAGQASRALIARSGGLSNSNDVTADAQEIMAAQKRRIAELEAQLNSKADAGANLGKASTSKSGGDSFSFGGEKKPNTTTPADAAKE